jgi:site-specific DNA-methyltransferase (adenine-specific)
MGNRDRSEFDATTGRWPANLIHDGSEEVTELFPDSKTKRIEKPCLEPEIAGHKWGTMQGNRGARGYDGEGSAARFFYCAKASKKDRDEGLESCVIANRQGNRPGSPDETGKFPDHDHRERTGNFHPTVKPTDLMRYLCRLITPPGGVVLDPWMGSGSTGKAAKLEGFKFIGIEMDSGYFEIAKARITSTSDRLAEENQMTLGL